VRRPQKGPKQIPVAGSGPGPAVEAVGPRGGTSSRATCPPPACCHRSPPERCRAELGKAPATAKAALQWCAPHNPPGASRGSSGAGCQHCRSECPCRKSGKPVRLTWKRAIKSSEEQPVPTGCQDLKGSGLFLVAHQKRRSPWERIDGVGRDELPLGTVDRRSEG